MNKLLTQLYFWAESYVIFPLSILSVVGSIYLVNMFQKAKLDLGALNDLSILQVKAILILMNTAFSLQATLLFFNKKNDGLPTEFREKVLNLCAAIFFFSAYCWLFR